MAEFVLRYADPRGQMHEQIAEAHNEHEGRERLAQRGYLVYSVRSKDLTARLGGFQGRTGRSLGSVLLKKALEKTATSVREGKWLSASLKSTGIAPDLALDMMEVGESTGALPQMLSSVAEFYEEDVSTRMTALLSVIEPAIMIFMGIFVAFVLIALYLPIFSLADTIR